MYINKKLKIKKHYLLPQFAVCTPALPSASSTQANNWIKWSSICCCCCRIPHHNNGIARKYLKINFIRPFVHFRNTLGFMNYCSQCMFAGLTPILTKLDPVESEGNLISWCMKSASLELHHLIVFGIFITFSGNSTIKAWKTIFDSANFYIKEYNIFSLSINIQFAWPHAYYASAIWWLGAYTSSVIVVKTWIKYKTSKCLYL